MLCEQIRLFSFYLCNWKLDNNDEIILSVLIGLHWSLTNVVLLIITPKSLAIHLYLTWARRFISLFPFNIALNESWKVLQCFTYLTLCNVGRQHFIFICCVYRLPNVRYQYQSYHSKLRVKGGFTQNPVTAYDPAYGQRQSSHMQQEHYHRQHWQSGLLKTILSKPEASRYQENAPGYGQRSLCEDCRWP